LSVDANAFELGPVGGSGAALLCLHGLTGTPYEVRPPPAVYEDLGIACVGPLLPGHGTDPSDLARTRRQEWVGHALSAFDQLTKTHARVHVLGLSLGGVLALRVAQERTVASALLMAAPIDLGPWTRLAVPVAARFVASIRKTPAIVDPVARQRHPGYRRMPLAAVSELIRLQGEVESRLGEIEAPLRLLYSRTDPTVSFRDAERILRGAAGTRGEVSYLERSGHVISVDVERDAVERWLLHSLSELESGCG